MTALEKSADAVVRELRRVPKESVKQIVADFVSEGFKVEQIKEPDGTYTIRALLRK